MRSSTSSLRSCASRRSAGMFVRVVEIGDRRREMRLARQQDVLGAAGQVGLVLLGERRDRKGVPAEGVGIAEIAFPACRRRSQSRPDAGARRSAPCSRAGHRRGQTQCSTRCVSLHQQSDRQDTLDARMRLWERRLTCVAADLHLLEADAALAKARALDRVACQPSAFRTASMRSAMSSELLAPRQVRRLRSRGNTAMPPLMNSCDPKNASNESVACSWSVPIASIRLVHQAIRLPPSLGLLPKSITAVADMGSLTASTTMSRPGTR